MSDSLTQKISPFSSSIYIKHEARGIGAVAHNRFNISAQKQRAKSNN